MLLAAALALAGCTERGTDVVAGDGGGTTTAPPGAGPPAAAPAGLVLQVRTGGGFVPVEHAFAAVPEFSLYDDGRVVVTGPTTLEYPGPALPNLLVGRLGAEEVRGAVEAARQAGVDGGPDLGRPPVADAPTTSFVLVDGGRTSRVDAYALGFDAGPGITPAQQAARARLADLAGRLGGLGEVASEPYRADVVSVLVRPATGPEPGTGPGDEPARPARGEATWPLGDLRTGGTAHPGGRCLGFTGPEAGRVLEAAGAARADTRWRSGDATWSLTFRPELPGVAACTRS